MKDTRKLPYSFVLSFASASEFSKLVKFLNCGSFTLYNTTTVGQLFTLVLKEVGHLSKSLRCILCIGYDGICTAKEAEQCWHYCVSSSSWLGKSSSIFFAHFRKVLFP